MRRIIAAGLAVCLFALAAPAPASAQLVDGRDPERLRALFERWGYQPRMTRPEGGPVIWINVEGVRTAAGLGGCADDRNCTYIILMAFHDDIVDAPWEWLNIQNNFFDVITLSRAANGILRVRTGFVIGRPGRAGIDLAGRARRLGLDQSPHFAAGGRGGAGAGALSAAPLPRRPPLPAPTGPATGSANPVRRI